MNERKIKRIKRAFGSRIAGIINIYTEELNQKGLIVLYKCENEAFTDNEHILRMFKNCIEMLKTDRVIQIGKIKTKNIDEKHTLTKVLVYD